MSFVKTTPNGAQANGFFQDVSITSCTIDREKLVDALFAYFKELSLPQFAGLFVDEATSILEYAELCAGARRKHLCGCTSLLFNPHRLDLTTHKYPESIYASLQDRAYIRGLVRVLLWRKGTKAAWPLYAAIQTGLENRQYVYEFNPTVARDLASSYVLPRHAKVLDPCAGWGGRMLGISAVVDNYTAFEPSTRTHKGLVALSGFIGRFNKSFTCDVRSEVFEEGSASLPNDEFDFAVTSPPYYDTEHYAPEESNNSMNRYATFQDWVDGFYRPLIQNTMRALKPGACFVLNVGSRRYPLEETARNICKGRYEIKKLRSKMSRGWASAATDNMQGEVFLEIKKQ